MKKFMLTTLALLGVVLSAASLTAEASAAYSFAPPNQNEGASN